MSGKKQSGCGLTGLNDDTKAPVAAATPVQDPDATVRVKQMKSQHYLTDKLRSQVGPLGAAVVPALINGLKHARACETGAYEELLEEIGDPAVPSLIELLSHKDATLRACAAGILGRVGNSLGGPALEAALKDVDEDVRVTSACALAELGLAVDTVLPVLCSSAAHAMEDGERLDYDEQGAAMSVVAALSAYGAHSAPAVPVLVKALQHSDPHMVLTAVESLSRIGADATAALGPLGEIVSRPPAPPEHAKDAVYEMAWRSLQQSVRIAAGEAIYQISGNADPIRSVVLSIIAAQAEAVAVRVYALQTLAKMSAIDEDNLLALKHIVADPAEQECLKQIADEVLAKSSNSAGGPGS